MTDIVVARRDGTLKAPDGVRYRLIKGRTLADADHPAVVAQPDMFMPVIVALRTERPEGETSTGDELAEVREQLATSHDILNGIANGLAERGIIDRENRPTHAGWLTEAVFVAIDSQGLEQVDDVAPPVRRGRPRKVSDVVD